MCVSPIAVGFALSAPGPGCWPRRFSRARPGAAPSLALFSIVRVVQGNTLGPVIGALTIGAIAGVFG